MAKKRSLDSITVLAPCPKKWDEMHGTDKTRFCGSCEKDIYNLSAMTRAEASKLLFESKEKICIRMERDENGKIKTLKNQLHQITRRAPIAAGVLSAMLLLSSAMMAQDKSDTKQSNVVITLVDKSPSAKPSVSGIITDRNGAIVRNVKVILRDKKTNSTLLSVSNPMGFYQFNNIEMSIYEISAESDGFEKVLYKDLQIEDKSLQINFALTPLMEEIGTVASSLDNKVPIKQLSSIPKYVLPKTSLLNDSSKTSKKDSSKNQIKTSRISFTVFDVASAVIPGAKVTLNSKSNNKQFTVASNDSGIATFADLSKGIYKAEISANGFKNRTTSINVKNQADANIKITLDVESDYLMGVVVTANNEKPKPLLEAIRRNDIEDVKRLVEAKYSVNQIDKSENNMSLLHIAVDDENPELVKLLLKSKARINVKDGNGNTPLMLAVLDKNSEIIRLLLEAGANPNLKNKNGDRAIDLTYSKEVEKLLMQYKSQPPKPE